MEGNVDIMEDVTKESRSQHIFPCKEAEVKVVEPQKNVKKTKVDYGQLMSDVDFLLMLADEEVEI